MLIPNKQKCSMQIQHFDENNNPYYEDICPYFEVKRLIKKLPTTLNLPDEYEIYFTNGKKDGLFRISTEQIYDNVEMAKIFGKNHFYIKRSCKDMVIDEIMEMADNIDSNNIYSYENKSLGWLEVENKKVFIYDSKIINGHSCECIRNCGNFTNGNENIYDKMLVENVLDNTPMTLAYILGFSGVIISRISSIKDLGVMIVGLTGTSSKGKTTALKLIGSIWGDPDETRGSLILRNKGSEIGFETQQAGLYGVPILYDDLDTNKKISLGDYIYELSKGTQRVLSKANGDTDLTRMGFSGITIITGENPLISMNEQRMGLCVRVIDFRDIVQAKDGDSANKIKSCIFNNYGFKGKKFAEFIEKKSDDDLSTMFDNCNEIVNSKIKNKDSFTNRISKKYAVILETVKLVNECFDLQIDENAIIDLSLRAEQEQLEERNKSKNAYNEILQYFYNHKSQFDIRDTKGTIAYSTERVGIALYKPDGLHIKLQTQTTQKILSELGFNQLYTYKKEWKANGYTCCEQGRFDMSNQEIGRHYHFVYPNITLEDKGE